MKLLLVEDDDSLRQLLQAHFTTTKCEVEVDFAPGGKEGFDLFYESKRAGRPYDAILTDIAMAGIDGYTLALLVRVLEGTASTVRIAFMTAFGEDMVNQALVTKVGAEHVWMKGDVLLTLCAEIEHWLASAQLAPQSV